VTVLPVISVTEKDVSAVVADVDGDGDGDGDVSWDGAAEGDADGASDGDSDGAVVDVPQPARAASMRTASRRVRIFLRFILVTPFDKFKMNSVEYQKTFGIRSTKKLLPKSLRSNSKYIVIYAYIAISQTQESMW
jgi:hypothetical protein